MIINDVWFVYIPSNKKLIGTKGEGILDLVIIPSTGIKNLIETVNPKHIVCTSSDTNCIIS